MPLFEITTNFDVWPITAKLLQELLESHFVDFDGVKISVREVPQQSAPRKGASVSEFEDNCPHCGYVINFEVHVLNNS